MWFGHDQVELVHADLGKSQFSSTFPSQPIGVWIPMTDGNGFTEDTNSYILMRVSLEPQRTSLNSHSCKDVFKTVSD